MPKLILPQALFSLFGAFAPCCHRARISVFRGLPAQLHGWRRPPHRGQRLRPQQHLPTLDQRGALAVAKTRTSAAGPRPQGPESGCCLCPTLVALRVAASLPYTLSPLEQVRLRVRALAAEFVLVLPEQDAAALPGTYGRRANTRICNVSLGATVPEVREAAVAPFHALPGNAAKGLARGGGMCYRNRRVQGGRHRPGVCGCSDRHRGYLAAGERRTAKQ